MIDPCSSRQLISQKMIEQRLTSDDLDRLQGYTQIEMERDEFDLSQNLYPDPEQYSGILRNSIKVYQILLKL